MSDTGNWVRVPNQGTHYFLWGHRLSSCKTAVVASVMEGMVSEDPRERCQVCAQATATPDSDTPGDTPEEPAETEPQDKPKRQRKPKADK